VKREPEDRLGQSMIQRQFEKPIGFVWFGKRCCLQPPLQTLLLLANTTTATTVRCSFFSYKLEYQSERMLSIVYNLVQRQDSSREKVCTSRVWKMELDWKLVSDPFRREMKKEYSLLYYWKEKRESSKSSTRKGGSGGEKHESSC
jgi:hypothetical protein